MSDLRARLIALANEDGDPPDDSRVALALAAARMALAAAESDMMREGESIIVNGNDAAVRMRVALAGRIRALAAGLDRG